MFQDESETNSDLIFQASSSRECQSGEVSDMWNNLSIASVEVTQSKSENDKIRNKWYQSYTLPEGKFESMSTPSPCAVPGPSQGTTPSSRAVPGQSQGATPSPRAVPGQSQSNKQVQSQGKFNLPVGEVIPAIEAVNWPKHSQVDIRPRLVD